MHTTKKTLWLATGASFCLFVACGMRPTSVHGHEAAEPVAQQGNVPVAQPVVVDEATARKAVVRIEAHSNDGGLAMACSCDGAEGGSGVGVRTDEVSEDGTFASWYGCARLAGEGGPSFFDPNRRCATVRQAAVVLDDAAWLALKSTVLAADSAALVGDYSCAGDNLSCASDPLLVTLTLKLDNVAYTVTMPNGEPQILPAGLQRIVAALVALGFRL